MSLGVVNDTEVYKVEFYPYNSLEQFRNALVDKYLQIYNQVIVQEKIDGSNVQIMGQYVDGKWNILLGSRRKWISAKDKFNNFQSLFAENSENIIALFNEAISDLPSKENVIVRLYGEIFGGKYGDKSDPGSFKTQTGPNYGSSNDFAFFDMIVDGKPIYVETLLTLLKNYNLKAPPVIYRGNLSNLLSGFNVDKFQSRVSKIYYNLDFIDTPKATEGVTIRTLNPFAIDDEQLIMKYKQSWALENGRVRHKQTSSPTNDESKGEVINACLDMMNTNRINCYHSKNTLDDITNPRMIGTHIKNLIDDAMKDIDEEFPYVKYPDLDKKALRSMLSKKTFPMFKSFVAELNKVPLTPEQRMENLIVTNNNLSAQVNILSQRLNTVMNRLAILSA
jgi:hypothetical protein